MKKYTEGQKVQAIKLVLENGMTQKDAAIKLSIPKSVLGSWVLAFKRGCQLPGVEALNVPAPLSVKPWSRWTEERLQEVAAEFTRLKDFIASNPSAYNFARKHGFLDKVTAHMERDLTIWTLPMLREAALTCKSRSEFQRLQGKAYQAALHMGVMDEICGHMPHLHLRWTRESILAVGRRYTSFTEFYEQESKAYQAAVRHNLLEEIRSHMKESENGFDKACVYLYQYSKAQYIGLSMNRNQRFASHQKSGAVWAHSVKTGEAIPVPVILHENLTVLEAQRIEREEIKARREQGIHLLNRRVGGGIGSLPSWTPESARMEALKYNGRKEFQRASMGAYLFAWRNGILNEVCAHMPRQRR